MALVDTDIEVWPKEPAYHILTGNPTNFTFDTSTDRLVAVFQIPKTGTISNVHYRTGSTSSSPSMTHRIELRTVDGTTGLPSAAGTLYGSSTSITVAASGYTNATNYTAAVNCTGATRGDLVALVMDLSAFTSGSFTLADTSVQAGNTNNSRVNAFPYSIRNTAASDVFSFDQYCYFGLEYAGVFYPLVGYHNWVGNGTSVAVTNSGVTRRGNVFIPKSKRRACGIRVWSDIDGGVVLRVRLVSDDSVLATATPDKDVRGGNNSCWHDYLFDSGATFTPTVGTAIYLLMEGTDATGGTIFFAQNAPSNATLDMLPGGKDCSGVTYTSPTYTPVTTTRYGIHLLSDQEDDGAGGSSGGVSMSRVFTGM